MQEDSFLGLSATGFHRVAYTDWGPKDAGQTVLCVHGLTRNGRDFDTLAQTLAATCRVVCPDVVGRGRSEWLTDPAHYGYPQYLADMAALIARTGADQVDWVGTSMGGLIGMLLAAQPKSPIRRLVMNDVGPLIPQAAIERIATYVGVEQSFDTLDDAETYFRAVYAPFGRLTDAQWRHLAEHGVRRKPDGRLTMAYDLDIAVPFRTQRIADVVLWEVWDAIRCPVLVLRGVHSDLLLPETADEMKTRGPRAKVIEIPDTGHAPGLMSPDQIDLVRDFLMGGD